MELRNKTWFKWLCAALLILIIPNILFWLITPKVEQVRGIFVIEYFFIACLYPVMKRRLFILLWILFAIYDLVLSVCSLFFMDVFELAHALVKIPELQFLSVLKWTGILILIIVMIWALLKLLMRYNTFYPYLRLQFMWPFMLIGLSMLLINNRKKNLFVTVLHSKKNIVSSPVQSAIKAIDMFLVKARAKKNIEYYGSVAKKVFTNVPDSVASNKEMLILVEAWGLLKNKKLQSELLQPLYNLPQSSRYTIHEGTNRYKYLTQQGEFRELTGYLFHYYQVQDSWVRKNSLLIEKQQQGYHIIGLHGYSSKFYRRHIIWPVLGVQEMYFDEEFARLSMPLCGDYPFRGVCDTAINSWLIDRIKQQPQRKEFYYWVTLNSHVPIGEIQEEAYLRFAAEWGKEGIPEHVLKVAWRQKLLFKDLANKLTVLGPSSLHILLVGDHAPPFFDPAERNQYEDGVVPYIEILSARH